jgi:hypothetical protein
VAKGMVTPSSVTLPQSRFALENQNIGTHIWLTSGMTRAGIPRG